jgi:hypothetical protein
LNSIDAELAALSAALREIAAAHPEVALDFRRETAGSSYFEPARFPRMSRADMECPDELAALEALWAERHPALVPLIARMRRLAEAFASAEAEHRREDADAPSTLVYQMW